MGREEQGVRATSRYALVPRTLVFLFRGEQVLLVRGASSKRIWPDRYNGIGGHVERGEDPHSAALRELAEETGLEEVALDLAGLITVDVTPERGVLVCVFRGSVRGDPPLVASAEGSLEWVQANSVPRLAHVPDLSALMTQLLAQRAGAPPFLARSWYDAEDTFHIQFVGESRGEQ
jgi:8-oxo-dGTP diphosphatase